jgi:hypothetical protein
MKWAFTICNLEFSLHEFNGAFPLHFYIDDEYICGLTSPFNVKELSDKIESLVKDLLGPSNFQEMLSYFEDELHIYWYGHDDFYTQLKSKYSFELAKKLYRTFEEINSSHAHDEYPDNLRCAKASSQEEVIEYFRRAKNGCCGFFDEEIEVDGEKFLIGFNYGH